MTEQSINFTEGDSCGELDSGFTCRKVINCPEALALLKQRRKHNFARCSFQEMDEIVCCPPAKGDSDKSGGPKVRGQQRKSAQGI